MSSNKFTYKRIRRFVWRTFVRPLVLKQNNEARYIIEKKVFPLIKNKKVLLVGVAEYCDFYPKILEKNNNDVWSIDLDSNVTKYGAKKHVVGDISSASKYFKRDFFDVILMGGVFGYGLNDKEAAEKTMSEIFRILKKDGLLIIWWSDSPKRNMVVPSKLKKYKLFKTISIRGVPTGYKTKEGAVFEFLVKKKVKSICKVIIF